MYKLDYLIFVFGIITTSKCNFLRINAQMYNLDKQKTTPACKT